KLPLILFGDSAGGNLATVCARLARESGGPEIALQILAYPVADSDLDNDSYRDFGRGYVLSRADMDWFFTHYLPDPALRADPRVAPLRAGDLRSLPPALILTAEYDVLRDEAEVYARRLAAAGVKVQLRRYRGVAHGFLRMANLVDIAEHAFGDIGAAVDAAL